MSEEYGSETIALKDGVFAPTGDVLSKTFWLLCRNTSVTYIERMVDLLEKFSNGYAKYVNAQPDPGRLLEQLADCYKALAAFHKGLSRLKKGDQSGYKLIQGWLEFRIPFHERKDDTNFEPIGYNYEEIEDGIEGPSSGLWLWIDRAVKMSLDFEGAMTGELWYPFVDVTKHKFPSLLGGFPLGTGTFIKTGDDIPIAGIWMPRDIKGGCPNFLLRGRKAPMASRAVSQLNQLEFDTDFPEKKTILYSSFGSGDFPSIFELVWEDTRYRDGRIPLEEQEYLLDDYTQFPSDPPEAIS